MGPGERQSPWGDRPSIYRHIQSNIRPGEPGLGEKGDLFPDETVRGGKDIRWAPGAFDGVLGHHVRNNEAAEVANKILGSLRALTAKATDEQCAFTLLAATGAIRFVLRGQFIGAVVADAHLDTERDPPHRALAG